jgi:hypothetical protein
MIVWKLAISPAQAARAGGHSDAQYDRKEGADDQGQQPRKDAARHILLRIVTLLGRQRQLLDSEIEP